MGQTLDLCLKMIYLNIVLSLPALFSRYPAMFDLSGARRKNATRETTSALKAWLVEHKKNPYPTKAEKIMLAIVTKMTLTQVSTWFANARRRLKKETKGDWSLDSSLDMSTMSSDEEERTSDDQESKDELAQRLGQGKHCCIQKGS